MKPHDTTCLIQFMEFRKWLANQPRFFPLLGDDGERTS